MAVANTPTTMAGFHKVVYADGVKPLLPENTPLQSLIKFKTDKRLGKTFNMPLETSLEGGFTFGGTTGSDFALNSAAAGEMQEAQVSASEIVLNVRLSAKAARASMTSEASFAKATDYKMRGAAKSFAHVCETLLLYGQSTAGIGAITGTPATSGSNKVITISDASWAPLIWMGKKGFSLDAYTSGGALVNTNAALVVVAVDLTLKTVTVSGNATDLGNLASTNVLVFRGSFSNAFAGFDVISSGPTTLFGITVANAPDVMKGTQINVGGTASIQHFLDAAAVAADRGADGKLIALIPSKLYAVLNGNENALRRYDGSYSRKKSVTGSESIELVSGPVTIEFVPSGFVKDGEAFVIPAKECSRVGTTDITDRDPANGEVDWHRLEAANASELRMWADYALFCERPAAVIKLYGITY
jgi:hypothetical protein